jgi:uncharacterized membrane protein
MAQFDSLIIFPLLWSLLLTLGFHYTILLNTIIPNFFGVKKFREKKTDYAIFNSFLNKTSSTKNATSYNHVFS